MHTVVYLTICQFYMLEFTVYKNRNRNYSFLQSAGGVHWHTLKKCGCADPEGVCLCGWTEQMVIWCEKQSGQPHRLCARVCVCVCVCVFCQWRSQNMSVYSVQSAEYAGCWGTSDVHFFINWTILLLLCGLWSNTCSTGPWCYLKLKRVWKCWHEHVQIFSVKITGYKFFWCTFMTLYSKSISLLRWLTTDQRAVVLTAVYNSIYSPCT